MGIAERPPRIKTTEVAGFGIFGNLKGELNRTSSSGNFRFRNFREGER